MTQDVDIVAGNAEESVIHILWSCSRARAIWKQTFLREVCEVWSEKDFMGLFMHVSTIAVNKELEWFAVVAWHLWFFRNKRVHGEDMGSVEVLLQRIVGWWEVFESAVGGSLEKGSLQQGEGKKIGAGERAQVRWKKPSQGVVKLNIDGAINYGSGIFGTGAICRDDQGLCIGILAAPGSGFLSPQSCEFMALIHGLHFCVQAGFTSVEVEGDAQCVFKALDADDEDLSIDGALVAEAKFYISCFDSCSWSFIPREGNKVAHRIAREALSLPYPIYWWNSVPTWLSDLVLNESVH